MTDTVDSIDQKITTPTTTEESRETKSEFSDLNQDQTRNDSSHQKEPKISEEIEQKERSLKRKQGPLLPENWVPPHSDSDDSENEPPTKRQHTEVDQTSMNGEKNKDGRIEEDDEIFGPQLPPVNAEGVQNSALESETDEKIKSENREKQKKEWEFLRTHPGATLKEMTQEREEWMTTLPESHRVVLDFAAMQRNVTSFSRKGVVERGDASVWTQSPLDKNRPPDPKKALETAKALVAQRLVAEQEKEIEKNIENYNKKYRSKSLLEEHLDRKSKKPKEKEKKDKSKEKKHKKEKKHHKDKKKKEKKDKKDNNVPLEPFFDRDRDLQIINIDPKKRDQLIRDAKLLNTRFAPSSEKKFL